MKKLTVMAVAALMLCTVPALAQENPQEKYKCEVQAGNCVKRLDQIQRKMKKVEKEVKTNKNAYAADDLNQIEQKLKEVDQLLDNLKKKAK